MSISPRGRRERGARLVGSVVVGDDPALHDAPIVGVRALRRRGTRRRRRRRQIFQRWVLRQLVQFHLAGRAEFRQQLHRRRPGGDALLAREREGEIGRGAGRQHGERFEDGDAQRQRTRHRGSRDESRHDLIASAFELSQPFGGRHRQPRIVRVERRQHGTHRRVIVVPDQHAERLGAHLTIDVAHAVAKARRDLGPRRRQPRPRSAAPSRASPRSGRAATDRRPASGCEGARQGRGGGRAPMRCATARSTSADVAQRIIGVRSPRSGKRPMESSASPTTADGAEA